MKSHENENHKAVERTLGYALALGDSATWQAFSAIAAHRLTDPELAALSFSALSAQAPQDALRTAEAVLDNGAGSPVPPFMYVNDEARLWASVAADREIKFYAVAAFRAMRPAEQSDFLDFASKEAANE